ncbi:MAG: FIST C-terminal domain-containing protein [Piscinibacter sp.]|uniref:FIST signal transduction protein n=1 Tax=Piscinibacter sp. TaxID=1903157 RepID=UPI0025876DF6|nr:FIST N-terminal domain-containing protein [Piscinibacter sp.]MCW5667884.1 FIST C-terminal domain-containing protein [Piscinibacter sp.]
MQPFLQAHATHPDWRLALAMVQPQLEAQRRAREAGWTPTLGWVYLTDHYATQAEALLAELQKRWPGVAWVGSVGIGVAASGVEYVDEPALSLMLADLPAADFRLFSGTRPLGGFAAHAALVHADPGTPDLPELLADLSGKTDSGYLFGGLASSRGRTVTIADAVLQGGLSGVAFGPGVALVSRVTQGCQPIGPRRTITAVQQNVVTRLDGTPALDCLLADLGLPGRDPREALPQIRRTLVGLSDPADGADGLARPGAFGPDTRVRHLIGLDPAQRGIAVADQPEAGQQLAFCQRHTEAARRDLVRICAEIREELAPAHEPALLQGGAAEPAAATVRGAVYVSCSGRGGPHFGAPSAELQIVRRALGDVPLVGFFANGEIARHHLYGYTGVLTVFTSAG